MDGGFRFVLGKRNESSILLYRKILPLFVPDIGGVIQLMCFELGMRSSRYCLCDSIIHKLSMHFRSIVRMNQNSPREWISHSCEGKNHAHELEHTVKRQRAHSTTRNKKSNNPVFKKSTSFYGICTPLQQLHVLCFLTIDALSKKNARY